MTALTIDCLGPGGSHSEAAARRLFPDGKLILHPSISSAIDTMAAGHERLCVVPIENALEGSVNITMDNLSGVSGLSITRELVWPIRHHLAVRDANAPPRVILSHPQALAQCRENIRRYYPGVPLEEAVSTSEAAAVAAREAGVAALCSGEAARLYGLVLRQADMQDSSANCTRFVVLCPAAFREAEADAVKTSIVCELDGGRAGVLYALLHSFACRQINLVRIESRPARTALGRYVFFLDLEGSAASAAIRAALAEVSADTLWLRVLGSYPVLTV